jgi:ABC-type antimicrobial peptide transport system permease subunit
VQNSGPPPGVLLTIGSLSAAATLLAAVGIFGLIAFAVAQRTREIGVRMALGARPSSIVGTLLAQYSVAMSVGAGAGVALAVIVGLLIRSTIIGLEPLHPLAYTTGLAVFAVVALVAVLAPARRALRIDPASALRWE